MAREFWTLFLSWQNNDKKFQKVSSERFPKFHTKAAPNLPPPQTLHFEQDIITDDLLAFILYVTQSQVCSDQDYQCSVVAMKGLCNSK